MTTISVPMPKDLLEFIDSTISMGDAENRAQAIRRAIRKFKEQTETNDILEASLQARSGRVYSGNIRDILKKRKNG